MADQFEQARALVEQARGRRNGMAGGGPVHDAEFSAEYPILSAFLCTPATDEAGASSLGSLTLFTFDGQVKGVLSDRVADRSLWASGATFKEVLVSLEDRLGDEVVDWRVSKWDARRRR